MWNPISFQLPLDTDAPFTRSLSLVEGDLTDGPIASMLYMVCMYPEQRRLTFGLTDCFKAQTRAEDVVEGWTRRTFVIVFG